MTLVNDIVFSVYMEVNSASILRQVSLKKGNERSKKYNNEEW